MSFAIPARAICFRPGRSQHDPRLARSCQPRYHQHLRRDRYRDEGKGDGALRCRGARTGSPVEGEQGADGLPCHAVNAGDYVAGKSNVLMSGATMPSLRNIIASATYLQQYNNALAVTSITFLLCDIRLVNGLEIYPPGSPHASDPAHWLSAQPIWPTNHNAISGNRISRANTANSPKTNGNTPRNISSLGTSEQPAASRRRLLRWEA